MTPNSLHGIWDPGLQPERTTMAWTRTNLSLLGCGVLIVHLLAPFVIATAITMAVVIMAVAIWGFRSSRTRYLTVNQHLHAETPLPGSELVLIATVLSVSISLLGLLYICSQI